MDSMVASLLPAFPVMPSNERELAVREAARFVRHELRLAPFHIRLPLRVLAVGLGSCYVIARMGSRGDKAAAGAWPRAVAWWCAIGGAPAQSHLRLLRSLALLAFLEHPLVLVRLGAPDTPQRQLLFRARRRQMLEKA